MAPSSPHPPSKRKHKTADSKNAQPSKKHKKTEPVKPNDKGKGRDREFQLVTSSMVVSVPPVFAGNPRAGVEEMLDSLIMRYIPALQGVVLSHSNLAFTSETGNIKGDCPYIVCDIRFDATIWNPHIGMKLKGRINLSSPDHISLLLHRTFNVSIPRHHIPSNEWEFEYGPAENDPEYAEQAEAEEGQAEGEESSDHDSGNGRWVSRSTGERLGGPDGKLEFTVIGLTVANEMLSLVGSIQEDPFSPAHVPFASASSPPPEETEERLPPSDEVMEDLDSEEEEDTFRLLKRKAATPVEEDEPEPPKPSKKKRKAKKVKD
ncbi:hypothetical protein EST38_g12626 [Candolleomyces aberdarensis]|uniref:RPA43 OB domain-containing protein n=1 Tax=Candolleomyces aberdarensis TaxID=2316362 RepID=A0A4Q2D1X9_9AGAR|nr:hypothetical protein EST38_g12626 [Candolleomyces aberdarensis]